MLKLLPKATVFVSICIVMGFVTNDPVAGVITAILGVAMVLDVMLFSYTRHQDVLEWFVDNTSFWDPTSKTDIGMPESIQKLIRRGGEKETHID